MSQAAFIRDLDEQLMGAFHTLGLADDATYTPAVGAPVACRVYVDRHPATLEQMGVEVAGNRIVIGILRAEVERPDIGGGIAIGSETFKLEARIHHDESLTRWVALPA